MKPLHELLKGKVVNCQTEEEAKEFLSFMHKNGYKWCSGDTTISKTYWEVNRNNTVYYFDVVHENISYGDKEMVNNGKYQITTYRQFKQLINENNMETKEVKIKVPEGYEIDKENSTFDCIKFKPIKKVLTYNDVTEELFKDKDAHYTDEHGRVFHSKIIGKQFLDNNNCTSERQAQKLLSINKLMNVARYLNGEWRPNWNDGDERKWTLYIGKQNKIGVDFLCDYVISFVYFKSEEAAQQAIEILGEETIKLALSTDW